ncbi:hypothetical protein ACWDRR_22695 [Kitasatospora sp. NPDC003701]
MTNYQCGSCPFTSTDPDEVRLHGREVGHPVVDGAEAAAEGARDVKVSAGPALDARTVGEAVVGVLGLGVIVALAWQNKGARAALVKQLAVAAKKEASLVAEVARLGKEVVYLKSASGAGKTLGGFRT